MRATELTGKQFADLRLAGEIAGIADRTPLHGQRGKALGMAPLGKRLDRGIGRDIITLSRIAERRGHGREEQEEIELVTAREPVERLGAAQFGTQRARESRLVEGAE